MDKTYAVASDSGIFKVRDGITITTKEAASTVLAEMISDISEALYSAAWVSGIEFALWDAMQDERSSKGMAFGLGFIKAEQFVELKRLSDLCEGWVIWDISPEKQHVPMEQWEHLFFEWKKK